MEKDGERRKKHSNVNEKKSVGVICRYIRRAVKSLALVSEDLIRHPVAVRAHAALVEVGDPLAARPHHHVAVRVAARAPEDGDVALERRGGGLVRADDFEAVVQEEVDARISVAPAVWQAASLECGFDVLGAIANRPRVCVLDERLHRFVDVQSAVLSVGLAAGAARVGL